jgi:hypothetical protein
LARGSPVRHAAFVKLWRDPRLEDDGKSPTPTKGFSGRAVIQDGGKTTAVNLSPAEPNMFVGQLAIPLGSKARVVFSAKVPGHTLRARLTMD